MYQFLAKDHERQYRELCDKSRTHVSYSGRRTLFYIFSDDELLYKNIDLLYDFKRAVIRREVYDQPFLTGGTRCLIDLAFHLYGSDVECDIRNLFKTLDPLKQILALNAIAYHFMVPVELVEILGVRAS